MTFEQFLFMFGLMTFFIPLSTIVLLDDNKDNSIIKRRIFIVSAIGFILMILATILIGLK